VATEQETWTELLDWYVHTYNGVSPADATAYGDTLLDQARELFAKNVLHSSLLLQTFGWEGQITFDSNSNVTWGEQLVVAEAAAGHLRDSMLKWLRDNHPEATHAFLVALIDWMPNFVMEKLSVPAETRDFLNKWITAYFGSKVDDFIGIDPAKPPADKLDQLYSDLSAVKASADKYMPLITDLILKMGQTLAQNEGQLMNLGTQVMWAINAAAEDLAQSIDQDHAEVVAMIKDLDLGVEGVKDLLMAQMIVSAGEMAAGLPADAELSDAFLALKTAYIADDGEAFRVAYVNWAQLTAGRRERLQREENIRIQTEREDEYARQQAINDLKMVLQLAALLVPMLIKDKEEARWLNTALVALGSAVSLVGASSSLGPVGVVAGIVIIAIVYIQSLKQQRDDSPLSQLYLALRDLIDEVYTRLDQRVRDAIQLGEYNHADIMVALRDLEMSSSGIAAAVDAVQGAVSFLVTEIDQIAESALQLAYTVARNRAELTAQEYLDPQLNVVTDADLHACVRDWFSIIQAVPGNPAAAKPAIADRDNTYDNEVTISFERYPLASVLNIIDGDASQLTSVAPLAATHINPEHLWEMLPDFENYLLLISDGFTLSESTYRAELVRIFHACQEVIGLRLCIGANSNLYRQQFWNLIDLVNRFEDGVDALFWDNGNFESLLNEYYRRPENRSRYLTFLGDQFINSFYARLQFPGFPLDYKFLRRRLEPWLAKDRPGLVKHFPADRMYFSNAAGNQETLAYFADVPLHDDGNGALFVDYKDLNTVDQWRLAIFGPEELGIHYHDVPGFAAGTVQSDYSAFYPDWSEQELKEQILGGVAYAHEDIQWMDDRGGIDLPAVLGRSMYAIMQQRHPNFYESAVGYHFSALEYGPAGIAMFFEQPGDVNQAAQAAIDFGTTVKAHFYSRFDTMMNLIVTTPPWSATRPETGFAQIFHELSTTITRLKTYIGFGFHDEAYAAPLNGFLDRIEETMRGFRFGDFDPLDMARGGFGPALDRIRTTISNLAWIIDQESERLRATLMLFQPLNVDFGNCGEMMRIVDRICRRHFNSGLTSDEIRNPVLNGRLQAILDAPLIEAVPRKPQLVKVPDPMAALHELLRLIELGYRFRTDPRVPGTRHPGFRAHGAPVTGAVSLLMSGEMTPQQWESRKGTVYSAMSALTGVPKSQLKARTRAALAAGGPEELRSRMRWTRGPSSSSKPSHLLNEIGEELKGRGLDAPKSGLEVRRSDKILRSASKKQALRPRR